MNSSSALAIITDIGDSASLLAISAAGSVYLISRRAHRAAFFLFASLLISALFISLLKLMYMGCQSYFHTPAIHSPSGHMALSAAVLWAYALLMRSHLEDRRRFLPLLLLTLLIAAIGASRVLLHYHTPAEVWIGLITGIISIFLAYFLILRGRPAAPFDPYVLALWGVVAAFALHGTHLPAEALIRGLASHIKSHVSLCGVK